jgi:hypothetical protein
VCSGLTYVLSWRTKLEKLRCLNRRGSSALAKTCESQTTKLLPAWLQETTESVDASSTRSKVLVRNGGGPTSWSPSIGRGAPLPPPPSSCSKSSAFTMPGATGSMARGPRTQDLSAHGDWTFPKTRIAHPRTSSTQNSNRSDKWRNLTEPLGYLCTVEFRSETKKRWR